MNNGNDSTGGLEFKNELHQLIQPKTWSTEMVITHGEKYEIKMTGNSVNFLYSWTMYTF